MTTKNKRLIGILLTAVLLLLVPLIAMQYTNEVNWNISDFVVAGILLFGTGLMIELVIRRVKQSTTRIIIIFTLVIILMLVWAELAVGLFDTPFGGS